MEHHLSQKAVSNISALLSAAGGFLISLPFLLYGDRGRGLATMVCAMSLALSVQLYWDRRRQVWFWVTVTVLVAIHAMLVILIPWPNPHQIGGPGLLPIGLVDVGIICGTIALEHLLK